MIPAIARNTIIFTWSITIYGFIDFHRFLKAHKREGDRLSRA